MLLDLWPTFGRDLRLGEAHPIRLDGRTRLAELFAADYHRKQRLRQQDEELLLLWTE